VEKGEKGWMPSLWAPEGGGRVGLCTPTEAPKGGEKKKKQRRERFKRKGGTPALLRRRRKHLLGGSAKKVEAGGRKPPSRRSHTSLPPPSRTRIKGRSEAVLGRKRREKGPLLWRA